MLLEFLLFVLTKQLYAQDDDEDEPVPIPKGKKATPVTPDEDEVVTSKNEPWIDPEHVGYAWFFFFLMMLSLLVFYFSSRSNHGSTTQSKKNIDKKTPEFQVFQKVFLIGFGFNVAADWMQGPYVYKLYSFYGFSKGEIGTLFVAGFFSSMVFGTCAAGLADRFGRKKMCSVYSLVYALACMTKHSTNFYVLILGRCLAGIATSILHSGFESWYVAQHKAESFPEELMIETLSWMSFIKGLVAIIAAVTSSLVASRFGFVAPFDVATILLILGLAVVQLKWKENYGDRSAHAGSSFSRALVILAVNPKVWLLGFVQACFEGAMYIFVFSWTPILESSSAGEDIPHGIIFGCFMLSIMIGSNFSQVLLLSKSSELVTSAASILAAISLFSTSISESHKVILFSFCLFEACVGVYFPAIASQRARHVPNEVRATIMGIFRVPLNLIVILTLLNASQIGTSKLAVFSSMLLGLAFCGERGLSWILQHNSEDTNQIQKDEGAN